MIIIIMWNKKKQQYFVINVDKEIKVRGPRNKM